MTEIHFTPEPYKSTKVFDEATLPQGFKSAHKTKPGSWAVLQILSGSITYIVEETGAEFLLSQGDAKLIAPEELHHVRPDGPIAMQLHFFKQEPTVTGARFIKE